MSNDFSNQSRESTHQELVNKVMGLAQAASTESALFHQVASEKLHLGITDTKTLTILMEGAPKTAGQLAELLNLTTGAVTNVIDRLEKAGYVERASDPQDRRKVVIALRPEKMAEAGKVYQSMAESAQKLYSSFSAEELTVLEDYYQKAIGLTRKEISKLRD